MSVYDDLDGEKYKTEANQKDADRIREDLRDIARRTEFIGRTINRIVAPQTKPEHVDTNYTCTDKETGISIKMWQEKDGAIFRQVDGLMSKLFSYNREKLTLHQMRDFCTRELAAYLAGLGVKSPSPKTNDTPTQDTGWKHMANLWQAKANVFECRVKELTAQLEDKNKTIKALRSSLREIVERARLEEGNND